MTGVQTCALPIYRPQKSYHNIVSLEFESQGFLFENTFNQIVLAKDFVSGILILKAMNKSSNSAFFYRDQTGGGSLDET